MISYARIKPTHNEVELHPLNTQDKLLSFMKSHGIVPIGYCPLARGADTRKCPNLLTHEILVNLSKKYDANASQILLAYGLARGCVMIPKTSNLDRLKENADSNKIKLSEEDVAQLSTINENHRICDDYPWMLGTSIFS